MLWTNHYVNFSIALRMQNLCLVYPPYPPFLFITGDSSQASPFLGSIPGASFLQTSHLLFSASPPVYCWWSLSMPVTALIQVTITCLLGFLFLLHSEFLDYMCDGVCLTSKRLSFHATSTFTSIIFAGNSNPWPVLTDQRWKLDIARISKMEIWILRGDCLLKCSQRNIGSCSAKKYRNKCCLSNNYLPGTVLGMDEPARNKPDKIFAFMKLTLGRGKETNTRVRERAKEHGWVSWAGPWELPMGSMRNLSGSPASCLYQLEIVSIVYNLKGLSWDSRWNASGSTSILFTTTLWHREEGHFLRSIDQKLVEENEKVFLAILPYISSWISGLWVSSFHKED